MHHIKAESTSNLRPESTSNLLPEWKNRAAYLTKTIVYAENTMELPIMISEMKKAFL